MLKFLTYSSLFIINILCQQFILNDKRLVSYQNKVYNITNYKHPGGQATLLLSGGKPLENYFNMNEYKFHITSNLVKKDLETLYIGNICNKTINNNINPHFLYLSITLSLFLLYCVITYFFYHHNTKLFYFLWWITLLLLSVFSKDEILERLGIWICYNIAFTLLPITKNSIWNNTKKLLNMHKIISILCLFSVITKIIVILILYNYKYLYINMSNIAGLISSLSIIFTTILAIPPIRKNCFELFYYSHKILFYITIISMCLHYIICLYYIAFSILLYFIDIIIRRFKTRKAIYSKVTVHEFKKNNTSYIFILLSVINPISITNPGSYFLINCDKISFLEWHPLSLISYEHNNLLFCVKNMGKKSWSNNIKKLENTKYLFHKHNTFLQGPYYHIDVKYNQYDYIINIANGIGITPFFSILQHINNNFTYKKVIIIWIIPNIDFLKPFINHFDNLINIDIQIFLTKDNEKYNYHSIKINNCKPNIFNYVKEFIDSNNITDKKKLVLFLVVQKV